MPPPAGQSRGAPRATLQFPLPKTVPGWFQAGTSTAWARLTRQDELLPAGRHESRAGARVRVLQGRSWMLPPSPKVSSSQPECCRCSHPVRGSPRTRGSASNLRHSALETTKPEDHLSREEMSAVRALADTCFLRKPVTQQHQGPPAGAKTSFSLHVGSCVVRCEVSSSGSHRF